MPPLRIVVVLLFAAGSVAHAQSSAPAGDHGPQLVQPERGTADQIRPKKVEADAARLVSLAKQLKTSVDKTNKDMLSVEVVREAERIEKLAHEVRTTPAP